MTPSEAANHYLYLKATAAAGVAASFARDYEERSTESEFGDYLRFLDIMTMNAEAAA